MGEGVGNVPLITPWAAAGVGTPPAGPPGEAAPGGRPRRHVPVSYLASELGQRSSCDRLSGPAHGALCLSCWPSAGTSARAFEDADREEDNTPVLGTLAYKGCPPRLSQLGAWRQDLPPWRRGLGLPAKAAAECSSRDHVPSLLCPAFQLNPNYKRV